jgi:ABC-2 type transport system permease protein
MRTRTESLAGSIRLLRLALRRDRVRIPIWVLSTAAMVGLSAGSVRDLYATAEQRSGYARLVRDNAAMIVQAGPGYGLDEPTVGAILMNELSVWILILVAVLGVMMTTRHTRAEEETLRAELVRSAPVGRHAAAVAGMAAVAVAQLLLAGAVAALLVATGYGAAGAAAFGAALFGVGMAFAAISLVAGQVASTSRAANGLALAALGAAFVIRAVGDVQGGWLSWASPIHWGQAVRAYAGERWLALAVPLVVCAALVTIAGSLADRRDFGGGLLAQRPGRAEATARLAGPIGLALRLHRGAAVGWAVGVAALGVFYGIVADEAEQMLVDNPQMADYLAGLGGGSIVDAFLATGTLVIGLLAGGYLVSAVLRMRAEETAGRVDPLLAAPMSRVRWVTSHLVVAMSAAVALLLIGGLAAGVGAALTTGDGALVGRVGLAALAMAPAPLALGAVAFLLCAAAPRWAMAAWALFGLSAAIGLLADALGLPSWVTSVSPYRHIPALPAVPFRALPIVVLLMVAAIAAAAGCIAITRRDIGRV